MTPTPEIEVRKAAAVLDVRFPDRILDLIVVPYDEETEVLHRGRWVTESVAPGAFKDAHEKVAVNRAHDYEQPLGRVVKFHPNDARGLRTEVRIAKTRDGDDVLELAGDGLLAPSIGMYPRPGGESYNADRTVRRITSAVLHHIGMTGDPAYTGAKVLAVRSKDDPPERVVTPNLDRIRLEMLAERAGYALSSPTT